MFNENLSGSESGGAWYPSTGTAAQSRWQAQPRQKSTRDELFVTSGSSTNDNAAFDIAIAALPSYRLSAPIRARMNFVDGEWIANAVDFPLYGSGETTTEAREMLEREIESYWDDLNEDVEYGERALLAKRHLRRLIVK
jgi:hypothetical protein